MIIPSISKLFGGWDIKLSDDLKKRIRVIGKHFGRLSSIFILLIVFWVVVDVYFNGLLISWMDRFFLRHWNNGAALDIVSLKNFVGFSFVFLILLIYGLVEGISAYRVKQARRKHLREIEAAIEGFVSGKDEEPIRNYPQVRERMIAYRDAMLNKEEIIRYEAVKKNELITYLAHDLKTPLTSVIGYLSLLDEADDMPAQQRCKYVKIALDKADRLEMLLNEFFEITRYNYHGIKLSMSQVNLSFMLVQLADEFYPIVSAGGKRIILDMAEDLMIYADSMQLARAFNNILKNAISYSFEDTAILVSVKKLENQLAITFQNEGKEIPQTKLDTIFEKFYRLDEARATNNGGAGLGLAIAKEIIKLHQGEIFASSEAGRTIFTVILPDQASTIKS